MTWLSALAMLALFAANMAAAMKHRWYPQLMDKRFLKEQAIIQKIVHEQAEIKRKKDEEEALIKEEIRIQKEKENEAALSLIKYEAKQHLIAEMVTWNKGQCNSGSYCLISYVDINKWLKLIKPK